MRSVSRRTWFLALVLMVALVIGGCGGAAQTESSTATNMEAAPAATRSQEVAPAAEAESGEQPAAAAEQENEALAAQEQETASAQEGQAEETDTTEEGQTEEAGAFSQGRTFAIVSEESEARFILSEELFGQPKTVVGATNQISGEIQVVPDNPPASRIGVITIDARSFQTDSGRRNGAIRRFILQSERDEYRYITFTPTEIRGLPESVAVGDTVTFQVVGDLKIRDIVQPVTFDVTLEVTSEEELRGSATTQITRDMFDLRIPSVPNVANVSNEVTLEFDFVARPAR